MSSVSTKYRQSINCVSTAGKKDFIRSPADSSVIKKTHMSTEIADKFAAYLNASVDEIQQLLNDIPGMGTWPTSFNRVIDDYSPVWSYWKDGTCWFRYERGCMQLPRADNYDVFIATMFGCIVFEAAAVLGARILTTPRLKFVNFSKDIFTANVEWLFSYRPSTPVPVQFTE